jgi:hypothetical protein
MTQAKFRETNLITLSSFSFSVSSLIAALLGSPSLFDTPKLFNNED